MILNVLVDPNKNVVGYSDNDSIGINIEVPETFKDDNYLRYKIVDGKLEEMSDEDFDKLYPNYYAVEQKAAQEVMFMSVQREVMLQSLPNEKAVKLNLLYSEWDSNAHYDKSYIVKYTNKLFRCLQAHQSQESWTPAAAPSLWVEIADPSEEYPQFKQPTGAHDCYKIGDKITFEKEHYVSEINSNVWSPTDYPRGWRKVS